MLSNSPSDLTYSVLFYSYIRYFTLLLYELSSIVCNFIVQMQFKPDNLQSFLNVFIVNKCKFIEHL